LIPPVALLSVLFESLSGDASPANVRSDATILPYIFCSSWPLMPLFGQ
jgi:hypothetical protein